MAEIPLPPVDQVEILSIMDNTLDVLMASTSIAKRAPLLRDKFSRPQLRAEHGVSMLITVQSEGRKDSFLFDAGTSIEGALHNMDVLGGSWGQAFHSIQSCLINLRSFVGDLRFS